MVQSVESGSRSGSPSPVPPTSLSRRSSCPATGENSRVVVVSGDGLGHKRKRRRSRRFLVGQKGLYRPKKGSAGRRGGSGRNVSLVSGEGREGTSGT